MSQILIDKSQSSYPSAIIAAGLYRNKEEDAAIKEMYRKKGIKKKTKLDTIKNKNDSVKPKTLDLQLEDPNEEIWRRLEALEDNPEMRDNRMILMGMGIGGRKRKSRKRKSRKRKSRKRKSKKRKSRKRKSRK